MEIIRAKHMGFCFGVSGAIETCYNVLKETENLGKKIYILGMLVHNEFVVKKLEKEGFETIEEEDILKKRDKLKSGDIVIIRAHGTSEKVYNMLKEKNIKIYDATCIFVTQIRKTLIEMEAKGYEILFVGDKEHPEVKGIISFGKNIQVMSGKNFNTFVAAAFRRHRTLQESLATAEGDGYLIKPAFADFIQLLKNNVNILADFFIVRNNFLAFAVLGL